MMKKQGNGGPRNSPVGNLQIFCRYDQQSVFDTINDASANVPATFASGAPENFDLLTDEIAFIQLDHPSAINKSPSAPPVRSSLNGLGSHAAAAFPGDTAAQVIKPRLTTLSNWRLPIRLPPSCTPFFPSAPSGATTSTPRWPPEASPVPSTSPSK